MPRGDIIDTKINCSRDRVFFAIFALLRGHCYNLDQIRVKMAKLSRVSGNIGLRLGRHQPRPSQTTLRKNCLRYRGMALELSLTVSGSCLGSQPEVSSNYDSRLRRKL